MAAQRIQWLRESWSYLKTKVYNDGQVVVDTTNHRLVVYDGGTVGGTPAPLRMQKTGAPTTVDLQTNMEWGIFKDLTAGTVVLAFNDGGTIKKVTLT